MKNFFHSFLVVLWVVFMLNCSLSAIINENAKVSLTSLLSVKCNNDEITAPEEGTKTHVCLKKCTDTIMKECKNPFGVFSSSQNDYVCGYNQN